jgi:hypothetical protein
MLSVPPKFGPRVDEPERDPSRPKERKEIHLKKSPAPDTSPAGDKADDAKKHQDQPAPATSEDQHPELNMKTAANIPAVPEQSKQLFAGKIAKPQVPQQAKRPQISPQQKLTSNVPPVPRRPDQKNQPENKSAPEKAPPQSTRDEKEIEYISFNQAEEEFGPLKVNGSHHQDPEDPAVPRDHDPAVPSGRQTSAVAPLPRRETARIPLPRNRFSRAAAENPPRQTAAPRAHDTRESSPDADADAPASRNGHHAPAQFTPDSQFDNPVLREIFLTDDPLDLDKIAQLTTDFPGITHCFIILRTPEGDQLAGTLPSDWDRRQFSRKALDFAHKTSDSTEPLGIGNSSVFTLYCEAGIISFFTGDQICVSVKHHQRGFLPGVREKLQRVTEELGNILLTSTSN